MENYDNLCYITKISGILSYFVLYMIKIDIIELD